MRRTIYATKADDLKNAMSEYDATTTELQQRYNKQMEQYRGRVKDERDLIEKEVRDAIGPSSIEDIRITANQEMFNHTVEDEGTDWTVSIRVNDVSKWNEDVALAWNYDVKLNEAGDVVKETGSWSGLKAATPAQLDDLKESVRLMEIIGNIDWKSLLHRVAIKWSDYIDEDNATALHDRQKSRPDFEEQIKEAEVADYVGTDTWIKLSGSPSSTYGMSNQAYWAQITKETPARYVINMVPDKYIGTEGASYYRMYDIAVSKQNFLNKVISPVETFQ